MRSGHTEYPETTSPRERVSDAGRGSPEDGLRWFSISLAISGESSGIWYRGSDMNFFASCVPALYPKILNSGSLRKGE